MKEKKILIFEDEWATIRGSFDMANIYGFEGALKFKIVPKSQDITFDNEWENLYSCIFVDITLAKNTQMDGFNIIKVIQDYKLFDLNKVVILTGNAKIADKLKDMQINPIPSIIYKPLDFIELTKILSNILEN